MMPDAAYQWLIGKHDDFEAHVLASILALSIAEAAASDRPVRDMAGYDGMPSVLVSLFPHAVEVLSLGVEVARGDDERCLYDLLCRGTTHNSPLGTLLAGMIARRAQRPNHLWQDLGLRNRNELSRLMDTYFAPLARRNTADMKWKKFFFRLICRDAAYTLCTAPSCGECCDYDGCFDGEAGESLLAHLRAAPKL
jgi:nitrogen fixation protein NifQ